MLSWVEHEKKFYNLGAISYKGHRQMTLADLGSRDEKIKKVNLSFSELFF